jgi:hypothetical protein
MVAPNARAQRLCSICQRPISEERLEILPSTTLCVECARNHPPAPISAEKLDLSQASPITRNGFAPKD